MNIQLGIYEIFAAIIPGFVYLAAITQVLVLTRVVELDLKFINNLSIVSALFILVVAYLLGVTFGQLGLIWYKLFRKKNQSVEALQTFREKHKDRWELAFNDNDWHILLAFLRSKNMDLAREIERHLASSIMLRNVSFGFFLLAAINLIKYFLDWGFLDIFSCLAWFALSLLMIRESLKSRRWYYDTILSTVVSQRVALEESITPVSLSTKRPKGKKSNEK